MKRIGWAGLMRLGLVELKLKPDEFWRLTPAELALMAGIGGGATSLSRGGLSELLERFPDAPRPRGDDIAGGKNGGFGV